MSSPFSLTYYDPPPHLARHVIVFFHFASDMPQIEDLQPGALGQFLVFPQGEGEMHFVGHTDQADAKVHLFSGFSQAARFRMRGPWSAIGASLSPLGWAALTGVPASDHVDRFLRAETLLGREAEDFGHDLAARYCAGELAPEQACALLADWLVPRMGPVPARHERLVEATIGWIGSSLNPPVDDLLARLAYSRRQAERLVERYFGLPPAALARKYRAIRASAILARDVLTASEEAALAEAFYDQPHMVREIRRYCGYTPKRLGGEGRPILKTLLQMKNYDRLIGLVSSGGPTRD